MERGVFFFFSSRRRHTRYWRDWSSDVCSSDLVDIKSPDINLYLKDVTGLDVSAKDFRTWNATVLAAVALGTSGLAGSKTARKRAVVRAIKEVAHYLGNTPAVARASYIDPRIFDRFNDGLVIDPTIAAAEDDEPAIQGAVEQRSEERRVGKECRSRWSPDH